MAHPPPLTASTSLAPHGWLPGTRRPQDHSGTLGPEEFKACLISLGYDIGNDPQVLASCTQHAQGWRPGREITRFSFFFSLSVWLSLSPLSCGPRGSSSPAVPAWPTSGSSSHCSNLCPLPSVIFHGNLLGAPLPLSSSLSILWMDFGLSLFSLLPVDVSPLCSSSLPDPPTVPLDLLFWPSAPCLPGPGPALPPPASDPPVSWCHCPHRRRQA